MIKEGVFLGKRYEILGRIGSGGMADVYKGKDHKLNRFVAIKVLKSTYRSDETFIKKFLSEAQAAAGLMHPNVVNVYDVGQDRGLYYMVMELVEGITLKDYIEKKGKLSAKETISISIQMVTGIQAAHNCHIIHRDIKPQNIIISKDGKVKVTDFGIARATTSTATQAVTTTVMGSVHYTSPEQARGGIVDEKSDIYSAGITMYEMITGHVPFDGDSTVTVALKHLNEVIKSPAEEVPDIPYSLECIIMKCTQKLPNKRYMSCEELLQDLKHSLVDPEGDFVVLDGVTKRMPATSQDTGRTTVVMSPDELNRMKNRQNYNDDYDDDYDDDYEDDYDDRRRSRYDDDNDYDDRCRSRYDDRNRRKKNEVNKDTKKIMKILMVVAGVVIALLIMFLVGNAVGVFKGGKGTTTQQTDSEMVKVPDVTGKTYEEAQKELNKYDLGIHKSTAPSDTVAKGKIISQDPADGKKVKKHTTVNVVISSGEEAKMTTIPSVVGLAEADAEKALQAKNLVVKKGDPVYSDDVEQGEVVSVSPSEGAEVKEGTTVTLVISKGNQPTKVPKLTGKSQSDAEAALSQAGLSGNATEDYSDTVEKGLVISQDTDAGKEVSKGTTIGYVVSKGPKLTVVPVPSIISFDKNTAEKKLKEAGLTPEYIGDDYSDNYPKGQVFYQSVSGGTQVEKGTTVQYMVSKGQQPTDPGQGSGTGSETEDSGNQ
ncbi:Stk1 family PASTA domain-containing Ser/Thr kinase [Ruminococcus sp. TF10-12AC]|jgi:beta-lactam-binding protein with PASTA domain/serine/threonine protein kinase|nr:Stk1 family PASTA domain-containing Ser/Thr kinase [Ruminococcus sp. TF10-6]RGH67319.1 Stk1 family PASTA domain-containing Ser/Thr kinase [Ruminococcus sp. AM33-14]RGI12623.1 Stk1 family PASTA domain-containing Ser/Thr kinase [Ruminococcus sp. TF10-12AC]